MSERKESYNHIAALLTKYDFDEDFETVKQLMQSEDGLVKDFLKFNEKSLPFMNTLDDSRLH